MRRSSIIILFIVIGFSNVQAKQYKTIDPATFSQSYRKGNQEITLKFLVNLNSPTKLLSVLSLRESIVSNLKVHGWENITPLPPDKSVLGVPLTCLFYGFQSVKNSDLLAFDVDMYYVGLLFWEEEYIALPSANYFTKMFLMDIKPVLQNCQEIRASN